MLFFLAHCCLLCTGCTQKTKTALPLFKNLDIIFVSLSFINHLIHYSEAVTQVTWSKYTESLIWFPKIKQVHLKNIYYYQNTA